MHHSPKVTIRLVKPSDAEMLQRHCFVSNTVAETAARIEQNLRRHAAGEALPLVAEVDGVVVGNAMLARSSHCLYRHRGQLDDMVVSGEYQGRGIARRLLETLRTSAAEMGITILETSVRGGTPAEQVYRKVGFQEYGRLPGGIVESWNDGQAYDLILFWMPTK